MEAVTFAIIKLISDKPSLHFREHENTPEESARRGSGGPNIDVNMLQSVCKTVICHTKMSLKFDLLAVKVYGVCRVHTFGGIAHDSWQIPFSTGYRLRRTAKGCGAAATT